MEGFRQDEEALFLRKARSVVWGMSPWSLDGAAGPRPTTPRSSWSASSL